MKIKFNLTIKENREVPTAVKIDNEGNETPLEIQKKSCNLNLDFDSEATPEEAVELAKIAAEEVKHQFEIAVPVVKDLVEKFGDKVLAAADKALDAKKANIDRKTAAFIAKKNDKKNKSKKEEKPEKQAPAPKAEPEEEEDEVF